MLDLSLLWAGIIALGVFIYVMLDGFDLGIGILFPFFPAEAERDVMMNTVAPVWDGNETWLVLGGAGLFAAFPVVYSAVLSALYLPLILMLVGLIFRGVAFEIRAKANRTRHLWDLAFIAGSGSATFFQGVALGAYIQGIPVLNREFAGGGFDWLSPFSLFTGLGLLVTYAVLGCGWLIIKTEGELQRKMFALMRPL
ncbi:MAG: cytochrome d ubiquinol oxidase subunit II, partial [Pseudogulbenkiania sp.]|nr:cytochrome d ubiquinol oxidase subunit II [Pseudogulbenkiania sp.]